MQRPIRYRSGYKYQLVENYTTIVDIFPKDHIITSFIDLTSLGVLTIWLGYAWDGPSGPTIDTKNFMRGSLVHDSLYQLMRQKLLPQSVRDKADQEISKICLEDGMSRFRAWMVYRGLKMFGAGSAAPQSRKKVFRAP